MVSVSSQGIGRLEQVILSDPLIVSSETSIAEVVLQMSAARSSCNLDNNIQENHRLVLSQARSGCVLVVNDNKLLGIFTERDVVHLIAKNEQLTDKKIAEVMTDSVITLKQSEFTDIFTVLRIFNDHNIRHLPLVGDQEQIVGLITYQSLHQILQPMDLLRSRLVSEVMIEQIIYATLKTSILELTQLMAKNQVSSIVIVAEDDHTDAIGIVTEKDIVQFQSLDLPFNEIKAEVIMSSPLFTLYPDDSLWQARSLMQAKNCSRLVVTDQDTKLVGIITQSQILQSLNPTEIYKIVEILEEKVSLLEKEKWELWQNRHHELETEVQKRTVELKNQAEKEKLLSSIASKIRSSLDLQTTLDAIVTEVRTFLNCDRVFIYQFNPDWSGVIVAESIHINQQSLLNHVIHDPCFASNWRDFYVKGKIRVIPDIYQANLSACHIELLETIHTRAKILVPIVQEGKLWGLLSATQTYHPRNWQESEVNLLEQLSTQIAIAIQQADIYRKLQLELAEHQRTEQALRASQRRYASLAAAVPVGIFRTDQQGNYIYVNDRWCQITGLSQGEAMGKGWLNALHPEDREKVSQAWYLAAQNQRHFSLEYRFQRPDNMINWVFGQAVPEHGDNEELIGYVGTITDISQRKKSEISLQEREELLSSIAENIADGYAYRLIIYRDGRVEIPYISKSANKLLGNNYQLLSWAEIYNRIIPEDVLQFKQTIQNAIQNVGLFDNEYRIKDIQGKIRWFNSRGKVRPRTDGSVIIEGVALDITERRQAQADLQALVEGAATVTGKDCFTLLLKYIASFLGVRYALIVTKVEEKFQTAAFWADGKLQNNISGILQEMPCYLTITQGEFCCSQNLTHDFPNEILKSVGAESYVGVAIHSTDGETVGSLCILHDQSLKDTERIVAILKVFAARVGAELERQQAMTALEKLNQELEINVEERTAELKESQERWELALRGTNDGIWDWNLRTNQVFYSTRWKKMRGFADDEIGSSIEEWSNLIHRDDYDRIMLALGDHLALKTPFFQEEYRVKRKDGSYMWVLDRRQALWDDQGNVVRVVGSESDITSRKQTEQELIKINERLILTNAELQRATRLKDEFLANMSHELRTPLNAILGLSEGLQESVFGSINPQQEKAIATIERSGRHLLELINDILDLSKIESGKLELQLEPVSIKHLVDSTLPFVRQQALQKNIQLTVNISDILGQIIIDELRICQVLINLLNNAIKFTPEGGSVCLSVTQEDTNLVISVIDTGIGIALEDQSKLFLPFVQLDTKLSRQYTGTGLGLALVRRLVDLHNGVVSVDSELGKGSCFTVKLPYYQPKFANLPHLVSFPQCSITPENKKVLIIEDTPTAAEQVKRYLDEIGMEAVIYPQGEGAISQIISYKPALIILDILLPNISGWEVLTSIKSHPETQSIPVIIVSVVDEKSHGLELGATEYLVKPINRQKFHDVIHKLSQPITPNIDINSINISKNITTEKESHLILIVEDNEANIDTIYNYLESRGYRLLVAQNGTDAIALTKTNIPDLILMDIQMPKMDGIEATRLIRSDPNCQDIPIIALTGLAMPGDQEKCLQAGANEYLTKPVRLKQLAAMIEKLLQHQSI